MSYVQEIYNIENKARKSLCEELDRVQEIILIVPKEGNDSSDGEYDIDKLYDLPIQHYVGKHDWDYSYYITRLYKDKEGYFASGIEIEDYNRMEFNLFENMDSMVIAELADLLNSIPDTK